MKPNKEVTDHLKALTLGYMLAMHDLSGIAFKYKDFPMSKEVTEQPKEMMVSMMAMNTALVFAEFDHDAQRVRGFYDQCKHDLQRSVIKSGRYTEDNVNTHPVLENYDSFVQGLIATCMLQDIMKSKDD